MPLDTQQMLVLLDIEPVASDDVGCHASPLDF